MRLDTSQKELLDYICSLDDSCDVPCTNFKVNESDAMIEEYQYMTKQQKQKDYTKKEREFKCQA